MKNNYILLDKIYEPIDDEITLLICLGCKGTQVFVFKTFLNSIQMNTNKKAKQIGLKPLPIVPAVISSFRVIKKFNCPEELEVKDNITNKFLCTSIDFSDNSQYAAITYQDHSISLLDCTNGTMKKTIYSKKYGVGNIRFTHDNHQMIYASNPPNVNEKEILLRYLSLPDNKYIRYFRGHTKKVTSLEMTPHEDTFCTASLDHSVRLWDLRVENNICNFTIKGRSSLGYDPTGRVIAVADQARGGITLYDLRKIKQGGFKFFKVQNETAHAWTSLRFTNDGENLLLGTNGPNHYVLNSITGEFTFPPLFRSYSLPATTTNTYSLLDNGQDITVTPDGRFVLSGLSDGTIDVWDLKMNKYNIKKNKNNETEYYPCVKRLISHKDNPITAVGFNPAYMMMLSGSFDLACWQPNLFNLYVPNNHHMNAKFMDYL